MMQVFTTPRGAPRAAFSILLPLVSSTSCQAAHQVQSCRAFRGAAVHPAGLGVERHRCARLVTDPHAELTENDTAPAAERRMEKTIESVQAAFNAVRTGRPNPALLDRVMVTYYGASTPLNQLASVSISGTATLVVEPYDKSVVGDVEKALYESDLGMMPNSDGSAIRLTVPTLTKDRRVELVKQVKGMAEDGRVALRNIRRVAVDSVKKLEKNKELGKDESRAIQDDIQKLTDRFVKQIDTLYKQKDTDIMKV